VPFKNGLDSEGKGGGGRSHISLFQRERVLDVGGKAAVEKKEGEDLTYTEKLEKRNDEAFGAGWRIFWKKKHQKRGGEMGRNSDKVEWHKVRRY